MDPIDQPRRARLSAGEWLFQLTTITIGVLIALSFDALLQCNADRELVEEARATIALEIADNLRELDAHLASYDERVAKLDDGLKLLAELEAGVEPTIHEVTLGMDFPSLNDAGWQTAGRTGAMALMEYSEVQELAELYTLQALFTDTLRPVLAEAIEAGVIGPVRHSGGARRRAGASVRGQGEGWSWAGSSARSFRAAIRSSTNDFGCASAPLGSHILTIKRRRRDRS
jgi:hypothetical protein